MLARLPGRRTLARPAQEVQDHRVADRQAHHGGRQQRQTARRVPEVEAPHDLASTMALITARPQTSDRFQNATASAAKLAGTSKARRNFQSGQSPVRYSLSTARNSAAP